jgi:hypothetical protein
MFKKIFFVSPTEAIPSASRGDPPGDAVPNEVRDASLLLGRTN